MQQESGRGARRTNAVRQQPAVGQDAAGGGPREGLARGGTACEVGGLSENNLRTVNCLIEPSKAPFAHVRVENCRLEPYRAF